VAQWGCTAIYNLAKKVPKNRKRVSSAEKPRSFSTSSVQSITTAGDSPVVDDIDEDIFQAKLLSSGACESVARALLRYCEVDEVAQACCRALVVLLIGNDSYKSKLGAMGVCGCVVEALHLFPSSVEVSETIKSFLLSYHCVMCCNICILGGKMGLQSCGSIGGIT
jgi:hypothetical protein